MAQIFLLIVLAGFFLDTLVDGLTALSLKKNRTLPKEFIEIYPPEKYNQSLQYQGALLSFSLVRRTFLLLAFLGFWHLGGFPALDHWVRARGFGPILTGLLFIGLLGGLQTICTLPFSIYATFVIEERFGFNRTTPLTFLADLLKGTLLAVVLGSPILSLVLYFFENAGPLAWAQAWFGFTALQLFILFLAPAYILPLFNRFEPLPEGDLRQAIQTYASRQAVKLEGIYRMDNSKRSSKSNAFFAGFGRYRKLVLFDTLIEKQTIPELVSVLAHEIGHFKLNHIPKSIGLSIASSGLLFFFLSCVMKNEALFLAFQMPELSVYASLVFASFLYSPISRVLSIGSLALARKNEFEADQFALQTGGHELGAALKKLSIENLSHLYPPRLSVWLDSTHPPILERLRALK